MRITGVRIRAVDNMAKVKAIATINIDDEFIVHDLRVVEGDSGFFVAMPSRQLPNGQFMDVAHPTNSGTRVAIQNAVLAEFETVNGLRGEEHWPAAAASQG